MQKPSVLFINRVYAPAKGATGRMLADLAVEMAVSGWDVNVVTTGPVRADENKDGVFIRRLKAGTAQSALNYIMIGLRLFYAGLRFKKTDLLVTMTDPPMLVIAGSIISRRKKTAHIHWCQDLYPDLLPFIGVTLPVFAMRQLKKMSLRALRSCAKIIAIGDCMAGRLKKLGLDERSLEVFRNWPDREFHTHNQAQFHSDPAQAPHTEKPLIVNTDPKFRVLYAGNLGRAHPVTTILEAASLLQMSNPEIEFLFVGEGAGYDNLAAERTRRGLDNVRLLPTQPRFKLREMMQSGDVHLISMKQDIAGLLVPSKLYAALAAHRPAILVGPDASEAGQVLQNFNAGSVIAQGDTKRLADEILAYRMDGAKWFDAHKGAQRAAGEFSAEKSIKAWIACARSTIRYPAA